jgi:hypothetical protein
LPQKNAGVSFGRGTCFVMFVLSIGPSLKLKCRM